MTKERAIELLMSHLRQCAMLMPIEWVEKNGSGELMEAFEMAFDALRKQAEYEDMEEQGRLVLPCKPGDKVYRVVRWGKKNHVSIRERIISTVEYVGEGIWVIHSTGDDVLGKKCFLTREEAEQALKGGAN